MLNTFNKEERLEKLLTAIEPTLKKIKELMLQKNFKHFYIPDQFNYDTTIDEYFETEIWDYDNNLFAAYNQHEYQVRYTVDGVYLEDDELSFDIANHMYYDESKDMNNPSERMSVEDMAELAVLYDYYDYSLEAVLEFYVELLIRYDHENAFNDTNAEITYLGKPESISGNIYENYLKTEEISEINLKELLNNNMILGCLINNEELFVHSIDNKNLTPVKNKFFLNIQNSFQTAGVPIHIVSGEQLDCIYQEEHKKRQESNLYHALYVAEPLGIFVSKQQAIYLAGDRIAMVANKIGISYTHLAYIVRIHEIMHWVFQWKEKPKFPPRESEYFPPHEPERFTILPFGWHNQPEYRPKPREYEYFIPCEYEYIEESMANYMTLLWIDWLKRHIDNCATEKFLLGKNNLYKLHDDAIKFMSTQPEAYAVAVPLYEKCNPFNGKYVLPFLNWCFQKNSITDINRKILVGKLCKFYTGSKRDSIDAEEILKWYHELFQST